MYDLIIINFLIKHMQYKTTSRAYGHFTACLLTLFCHSQTYAQSHLEVATEPEKNHFSGFATLGGVYNANPDAGIVFSGAQTRPAYQGLSANLDSVIGLQWDYQVMPTTGVKLQAVARAGDELQPKIRMAYLDQAVADNVSLRAGRMRSPLFFDADTTEIGYANTAIRGPIPLYAGTSASQIIHIDGLRVQWRKPIDAYLLTVEGYWGGGQFTVYDVTKSPVSDSQINTNGITDVAVSVAFENGILRYSHARLANYSAGSEQLDGLNQGLAKISLGLNQSAAGFAAFGKGAIAQTLRDKASLLDAYTNPFNGAQTFDTIGFSTTVADLGISGEWAWLNSDAVMLGKREAYQISGSYKVGNFTPFVSYSSARRVRNWAESNPVTPTGVPLLAALDAGIESISQGLGLLSTLSNIATQGLSLGVRWDLASNRAAKLQYDMLSTPDALTPGAFKVRSFPFDNAVHLLSASVDVIF